MSEPVTYFLNNPMIGTIREGDRTASWTVKTATFAFLSSGQAPPPDDLVFSCHHDLRDAWGNAIPVEVLALLDLEQGLRDSFCAALDEAWDALTIGDTGE